MPLYRVVLFLIATSVTILGQAPNLPRPVTDDIAYGHFFGILAPIQPDETQEEFTKRQEAFCQHLGLNPQQGAIVLNTASQYHVYMADLRSEAERRLHGRQVGPASMAVEKRITPQQVALLRKIAGKRRSHLLALTREMYAQLDDEGDRLVLEFVNQRVRPKVRFGN